MTTMLPNRVGLVLAAAVIVCSTAIAQAQVSVTTPTLDAEFNDGGGVRLHCKVTNRDTFGQFVTINIRRSDTGAIILGRDFSPNAKETVELVAPDDSFATYCEAIANTTTQADLLSVGYYEEEVSTGNALAAVAGVRLGSGSGSVLNSPSIKTRYGVFCYAVNVDTHPQDVTISLIDDSGATTVSQTTNGLAAGAGFSTGEAPPNAISRRCQVTASTPSKIRADIFAMPVAIVRTLAVLPLTR
jgi:hypothetical protein